MQRVFRSTLVGLLAVAGLTACGDKITVPPAVTTAPIPPVVRSVTVTPTNVPMNVGDKVTLAASVNADAGITDRTVTWSSSDATIASVDANGLVTALKVGTTSVKAVAKADVTVSGAAVITVGGGGVGAVPTVTISSINQTNTSGQSVPANLSAAAGQLDVILNVETNGAVLRTVSATLRCGTDVMTRTQTISGNVVGIDADAASAPVTLSFNTAEFNATTGVPTLRNGACTISATATTAAGTQSATNSTTLTLNNTDGVVVTTAASGATASDVNGLPWKAGNITVTAIPVLFSGRVPATVTITLPGATGAAQTVTAATTGGTSATWSGTATSGSRVTQQTLISGYDGNGFPVGAHPTVLIIDTNGNDLNLAQLNAVSQSDVRIDNQSPVAPTVLTIPTAQAGWVNAAYTFTGVAAARYTSGGDLGVSNGAGSIAGTGLFVATTVPTVAANAGISGTTGLTGQTTFTYFAAPSATYTFVNGAAAPTTGSTAGACATTGLTQITTAGDLAATLVNTSYRVRVNETDKLGNVRCTDLGGSAGAGQATFGVDKGIPTAVFSDPPAGTSALNQQIVNIAAPGIPLFAIAISDDASGFSATPASTSVTRTTAAVAVACTVGTLNTAGTACNTVLTGTQTPVNGNGAAAAASEGYYVFVSTIRDQAQNAAPTLTRQALVDVTAPIMGGVSIPAAITGGSSAAFSTSATDNLDLAGSNYTVAYGTDVDASTRPGTSTGLKFRTVGPTLGVAFDNVLTTTSSFTVTVPSFIRNVQVTNGADAPVAFSNPANLPNAINVRAIDAANNTSAAGSGAIAPANVPQTGATNYAGLAGFQTWLVSNAPTPLCNAATCAAPANPTSVVLTATANGTLSTFQVPFQQVQFFYFDNGAGGSNEWIFIGTAVASTVTDAGATRTFTWSLSFDPPASFGTAGAVVPLIAVGLNSTGDALTTRANQNITVTP